jgi:hypothetical protein
MPRVTRRAHVPRLRSIGLAARKARDVVRLTAAVLLGGCAAHLPRPLQTSSVGAPIRMTGDFAGTVTLEDGVVTLQLERARARYLGWSDGDSASVEGVSLRAIVAADSAGVGIPLGVSAALDVASVLAVGEERSLDGATLAVPLPTERRARDLWLAFQFRGTVRAHSAAPELLIAYTCSELNLFGVSKSANARVRRMRASYSVGCRL